MTDKFYPPTKQYALEGTSMNQNTLAKESKEVQLAVELGKLFLQYNKLYQAAKKLTNSSCSCWVDDHCVCSYCFAEFGHADDCPFKQLQEVVNG